MSAGWDAVTREQWQAPLYWEQHGGEWMIRDYHGLHKAQEKAAEPVTHVSYFEAAAFAKWAGKRLPTEAEWEKAACFDPKTKTKNTFSWGNAAPDARHAGQTERRGGTVGFPLPGVTLRVVDEAGRPVETGEIGGIQVRGPNVFSGYWRMPEKTAEEFTTDGYFKTGDVGRIDERGYVTIVGRSKDLIISGGYNVYPAEIEGGGFFTPEQIDRWTKARPQDFATGFLECWRLYSEGRAPAQP